MNLEAVIKYLKSIDYISNVQLNDKDPVKRITFTCSETRVWDGTLTIRRQSWIKHYVTLLDSTTYYHEGKTVRNSKQIIEFLKYQYID